MNESQGGGVWNRREFFFSSSSSERESTEEYDVFAEEEAPFIDGRLMMN